MEDNLVIMMKGEKVPRPPKRKEFISLFTNNKRPVVNTTSNIEKVLISKVNDGDYSAFSSIFSAYYHDLVMFASRFTHNINDAEEIVQDTFVRLWEAHESIRNDTPLKFYLLKLVKNKGIDWCRHKKIKQTHFDFIMASPLQFEYDTDSYLLYSELEKKIENALRVMPEAISETFRMNRYKGLKYKEIADIMKVSERTIEVRMAKALQILRNSLKEYFAT